MKRTICKYAFLPFLVAFFTNGNLLYGQSKRELSINHIENLAKGILLIRLDNRDKEIELLKKAGNLKRLNKVIKKTKKQNEEIVAAFSNYYTFSDFCFYYVGGSKDIVKEKNFDNVVTDEKSLCNVDKSMPTYLLFFERKHWHMDNSGFWSFVLYELKENSIKRLEKPFPYYFETIEDGNLRSFFTTRYDFDKGVRRMNKKLENFYLNGTR